MPVVTSTLACAPLARSGLGQPRARGRAKAWIEPELVLERESETRVRQTVVAGYRIGELMGRGGMSVVFEVTHPSMHEPLAMKVVTDRRLQDDLAFETIYAHARTIAALRSPHVVHTLDAGRLPTGEPFIVMERLVGEDLATRLARAGALPLTEAIQLAIHVCDGLAAAHGVGVVHGDIKPANLILVVDVFGSPCLKIVDFAPSVPRAAKPDDPLVTCSPGYASPEQLGARPNVDGRADVWGVGAVLYELVTGHRAFEATTLPEMLRAIRNAPPAMTSPHGEVPALLECVVRRCLSHGREGRFESIGNLRAALAKVARDLERVAQRTARASPTVRRRSSIATNPTRKRATSPLGKKLFLAALGPTSALLSMTIVRLVLASGILGEHVSPFAQLVP